MYMYKERERGFQIDSLYIKLYKIWVYYSLSFKNTRLLSVENNYINVVCKNFQ